MQVNQKIFRITKDLSIEEFVYKRQLSDRLILEDKNRVQVQIPAADIRLFNFSRTIALTELEEILRQKIDRVHEELRQKKISFNPVLPFDVVISPVHSPAKPVHQYDLKTGKYIQTFLSVHLAERDIKPTGKHGSNISNVCKGKIKTNGYKSKSAYGYRWSYAKMKVLH